MSRPLARLGAVAVGGDNPVRVIAVVNVSPESFYKGSVASTSKEVARQAAAAIEDGADIIDVGGASTAPYLKTVVSEETEASRVTMAIEASREATGGRAVLSVDTVRARVAQAAIECGATVVNDVSGLKNDPRMARVVSEGGASLLAMAHSLRPSRAGPVSQVRRALQGTITIAEKADIDLGKVVLDPGIGFFRSEGPRSTTSIQTVMPWYLWDVEVLARLGELGSLGRPLGVGLSRKSFIGKLLALERPEDRLAGSLALTALAVANGASLIRTHDVRETVQAVRAVEAVLAKAGTRRGS